MNTAAVHIVVRGRVQGVWFRASAQERASGLHLTGWVRNRPDGAVELHAEGDPEKLDQFIQWCREGPPAAKVTRLDTRSVDPQGMETFDIR